MSRPRPPMNGAVDVREVVVVTDQVESLAVAVENRGDVGKEEVDEGMEGGSNTTEGIVACVGKGGEGEIEIRELGRLLAGSVGRAFLNTLCRSIVQRTS